MAWLGNFFSPEQRSIAQARALHERGEPDQALAAVQELDGDEVAALRSEIRRAAAASHLRGALDASRAGQGERARVRLERARRFYTPESDGLFRAAERLVRSHQVRQTAPEHWVELLDVAEAHTERLAVVPAADAADDRPPTPPWSERYAQLAHPRLVEQVGASWETPATAGSIEAADRHALRRARPLLAAVYPDDLADGLARLGDEVVRAALLVAAARPDLAALPLLELPTSNPIVCFERAKVAHGLQLPRLAMTALQDFAGLVGGHRTIRRLNTGVFLAQMAVAVGDERRALAVLDELPVRFLGKRPVALYARLLSSAGRLDESRALLVDHLSRHPAHGEAAALLAEVDARTELSSDASILPEDPAWGRRVAPPGGREPAPQPRQGTPPGAARRSEL